MLAARLGFQTASRSLRVRPLLQAHTKRLSAPQFRQFADRPPYNQFPRPRSGQQQWSRFGPVRNAQYLWRYHRTAVLTVGGGGVAFYVYNLEEVPITHRRRFNIYSPESEKAEAGGPQAYNTILNQYRGRILPADHRLTEMVAHVVERLLPSTGGLAGDEWRVHVIDDPEQKNAFVMPGGKVFVFTGILPICQTEAGIAAVLGHEIAHNVAHHAAEQMSNRLPMAAASVIIQLLFQTDSYLSDSAVNLLMNLPHSRVQEAEADHIGLLMMAEACYDPREAVAFWTRMKKAEQYEPPQFLSTHPTHYNRSEALKQWMPEALTKYADSGCEGTNRSLRDFIGTMGRQLPAP
ncbi:uncharacterized protein PV06_03066 [Exophiala oligosperma]|uniref:Peptidase M48 domain-containing protein n=2 Tax=Chaetothyriales TaxID=34395 RepID=A0A0D2DQ49_9EURO|nr:uncharacterized protein PV06_03066 [Exophiala oligosperma]KAJ9639613.1 metalloendopeptidase [Knufia peltigerae]KIW44610.1 hypothetical protein PV06_03066 [Exophiala oligosperma]